MDGSRRRLVLGLVVGSLLIVSGFLPHPILASPYETAEPAPYLHQAVPEDDSRFDRFVELYEFDRDNDAVSVDELSPTGQLAVERTLASDPESDGWYRYDLPVCATGMLVCDSVSEPPADFHYGEGPPSRIFTIVAADGQQYMFQTGVQTGSGAGVDFRGQPLSTYSWLFGLLPFGVLLVATQAIGRATGAQRIPSVLTALGGALLVIGVAVPYLTVFGLIAYDAIATGLFAMSLVAMGSAVAAVVWLTVDYAGSTESARRRNT